MSLNGPMSKAKEVAPIKQKRFVYNINSHSDMPCAGQKKPISLLPMTVSFPAKAFASHEMVFYCNAISAALHEIFFYCNATSIVLHKMASSLHAKGIALHEILFYWYARGTALHEMVFYLHAEGIVYKEMEVSLQWVFSFIFKPIFLSAPGFLKI